jgi:hypothetical protein
MTDGAERCSECGERHTDWTQTASRVVDGGYHTGTIQHWQCERCGHTMEVATA